MVDACPKVVIPPTFQRLLEATEDLVSDGSLTAPDSPAREALLVSLAAIIVAANISPHELQPEVRAMCAKLKEVQAHAGEN